MHQQSGLRLLVQVPVVPVDFRGDDAGCWQVVGQPRYEEIGKVGDPRIVANQHEVVAALVLGPDDVEDAIDRRMVEVRLFFEELVRITDGFGDGLGRAVLVGTGGAPSRTFQ